MKNPDVPKDEPVQKRQSLKDLANLDTEQLTADLKRALPGKDSKQVSIAAFNSSI